MECKTFFWFYLQLLSETFLILRRTEQNMIKKCTLVCMQSTRYSCLTLMKLTFSQHIFEKYSNIIFDEKFYSGSRVPRGQTDRRDGANSRFSQICERAENWQETKCTTDKPAVYVWDTRLLGYESDLVRSQRVERYCCTDVALNVELWGAGRIQI